MADLDGEPEIVVRTLLPAAPRDGGDVDVLIQVIAPPQPHCAIESFASTRALRRLALVVDCSETMAETFLDDAFECVRHIVAGLEPMDQVTLLLCRDQVEVAIALQAARAASSQIYRATSDFTLGQGSALHAGWLEGVRQLSGSAGGTLSRVILFSNGTSSCPGANFADQCAHWHAKGISTTTVGFGNIQNHEPMRRMARSGGGLHYGGFGVRDLCKGFDQELGLRRVVLWNLIQVTLQCSSDVISVSSAAASMGRRRLYYRLPDLRFGSESSLLLRLHIGPSQEETRSLFGFKVRANCERDQCIHEIGGRSPNLRNLDADTMTLLSEDEVVAARLLRVRGSAAKVQQ